MMTIRTLMNRISVTSKQILYVKISKIIRISELLFVNSISDMNWSINQRNRNVTQSIHRNVDSTHGQLRRKLADRSHRHPPTLTVLMDHFDYCQYSQL